MKSIWKSLQDLRIKLMLVRFVNFKNLCMNLNNLPKYGLIGLLRWIRNVGSYKAIQIILYSTNIL